MKPVVLEVNSDDELSGAGIAITVDKMFAIGYKFLVLALSINAASSYGLLSDGYDDARPRDL